MSTKKHYVNNKKLYEVLVKYNEDRERDPATLTPDYVGVAIMDISRRLATKANFANYPFKEEMIGDGIENAVKAVDNFNPDKYKNPFAYFTQIIFYAFLRRIDKEKKQLYTKQKFYENQSFSGDLIGGTDDTGQSGQYSPTDYMNDFVAKYEENLEAKRQQRKAKANDKAALAGRSDD